MHVLEMILNSVSFHHLTRKLKAAMTNLVRTPDQPISNVMLSYTSLLYEAAKLEDPGYDEHRAKEKAEKQACRTVRFFLEPALASQMEDLRKEFRLHFEKDMSLQMIIEFVDEAECEPQYQLRSPRGLKQQPFPMSIYNNQINRVTDISDSEGLSINSTRKVGGPRFLGTLPRNLDTLVRFLGRVPRNLTTLEIGEGQEPGYPTQAPNPAKNFEN